MRTKIAVLIIALFGSFTLYSQGPVKIGVTGGLLNVDADIDLSLAGFSLFDIDAVGSTGFYIGLLADIPASDMFHIQPELTYGNADDLSYFYLPVMAKIYVFKGLNLQAGPQFSYSSNLDDIKDAIEEIEGIIGTDEDLDDVLKSFTVEIGVGAGFDITQKFYVHARYAIPLSNIYDGPLSSSLDIKAAAFQFGLSYMFN